MDLKILPTIFVAHPKLMNMDFILQCISPMSLKLQNISRLMF